MSCVPATSLERVRAALSSAGASTRIVELPDSTHSAADAARAIGCEVAQIAKSIVFRAPNSDRPVLVIASGIHRVDEKKIAALLDEPVTKADAAFIKLRTGFSIGGVSPVGHIAPVVTLLDEDLRQYPRIWAAAGTPNAVFETTAEELQRLTGGRFAAIA